MPLTGVAGLAGLLPSTARCRGLVRLLFLENEGQPLCQRSDKELDGRAKSRPAHAGSVGGPPLEPSAPEGSAQGPSLRSARAPAPAPPGYREQVLPAGEEWVERAHRPARHQPCHPEPERMFCEHGLADAYCFSRHSYSALGSESPLPGGLSRLRWVTRRMITSMQKLQYLDALGLAGQGSQRLLRAPQNPHKPATGRLIPAEIRPANAVSRAARPGTPGRSAAPGIVPPGG